MTNETLKLAARIAALETLLVGITADGIARSEQPAVLLTGVRSYLDTVATAHLERGRQLGESEEAWACVAYIDALVNLRDRITMVAAAGCADGGGRGN